MWNRPIEQSRISMKYRHVLFIGREAQTVITKVELSVIHPFFCQKQGLAR